MLFSNTYVELLSKGAFSGQIDPWAEAPHYFQQIHASMIGNIAAEIQTPLMKKRQLLHRGDFAFSVSAQRCSDSRGG